MMPPPEPDKPTTFMRVLLGLALTGVGLWGALPVIAAVLIVIVLGLVIAGAVALANTGGLAPGPFERAHWGVLVTGVLVFGLLTASLVARVPNTGSPRLLGALTRRPWTTISLVLATLTVIVVRMSWGGSSVPSEIPATLILSGMGFFAFGAAILLLLTAARATRSLYRWAVGSRYRCGLVTGLFAVLLGILASATPSRSAPAALSATETVARQKWLAPVMDAASAIEAERRVLVGINGLTEPAASPMALLEGPVREDSRAFDACIETLMTAHEHQVRSYIERHYGLPPDDAHDIVRDSLLSVCVAHSRKRYERLGAVLQSAADRRAKNDWRRRRHVRCAIDEKMPSCAPAADELTRFAQEDEALEQAVCAEDKTSQEVIYLRVQRDRDFASIGVELGLSTNQARAKFHNAVRRMEKRLSARCGG